MHCSYNAANNSHHAVTHISTRKQWSRWGWYLHHGDVAKHTDNKHASEYASAQIQPHRASSDGKSACVHDKEMEQERNFSVWRIKAISCIHPQQKWRPKHLA